MTFPKEPIGPPLIPGRLYRYLGTYPLGCEGGLYRIERFVIDMPAYQQKVLVHCLEGKDAGTWFCCSLSNFALRCQLVEPDSPEPEPAQPASEPLPERVVDLSLGGGTF